MRYLLTLVILAVLVGVVLGVAIVSALRGGNTDGYGDDFDDGDHDASSIVDIFQSDVPTIPRADTDPDLRFYCEKAGEEKLTIQQVYQQVNPATVLVLTDLGEKASVGTGVILTADGYIVTNAHVIADGQSVLVVLADARQYEAELVGFSSTEDLALLKAVNASGLPTAPLGDSEKCQVGDTVYAIGNPLGVELRGTLTDGIVSAINRDVDVDGVTMTLIQTNAALNNGNSGGPLINQYGQVIGINVMKIGMDRWSTASVEGLGFAIPIASSAYIVNDILRCGEVQGEPVLGISVDRTPAYLPDGQQAARVYTVDLNGPGDKAGLEVDDLIYEADGVRVETSNDLLRVRHRHAAGEEMILKVCRGGEYLTVSVTLEAKR